MREIIEAHVAGLGLAVVEVAAADDQSAFATRYEKTATIYLAGLHIAGIFLWSAS
ncbi:DUF6207 family protein [Streptomyces sp. NPDC005917]|uniref:DUF6207 family protein n=1 Tax=unclassified Streptomyces TaxID=2593676 RepID=UPI0033C9AEDE